MASVQPATVTVRPVAVPLANGEAVDGLWQSATRARACLVLAHGAGASMEHRGMVALADGLASRGIATLRFQFPFMQAGSRRPDPPAVAQGAVRAAIMEVPRWAGDLPLVAGGRSFGGRMTSQAQAAAPLPGVRGLVFFAFPLHPAGKPSSTRADHLAAVAIPMLFVQGTRDALADMDLLKPVIDGLGDRAKLAAVDQADHSFHVPARSDRTDAEAMDVLLDITASWIDAVIR